MSSRESSQFEAGVDWGKAIAKAAPLEPVAEELKKSIAIYVATAIMELPNGGGKTWNEALEIGAKVAALSFASLDIRSRAT